MLIVGLTGGIAAGKTTVSRYLSHLGVPVIDCDRIAHETAAKGSWGYRRIVAAFGPGVLTSTGEIDREALGRLAFSDAAARRRLNKATHAPVAVEVVRQLLLHWLQFRRFVVIDMPLLFETGAYKLTRLNVVVACSPELQLQRVMQRDRCSATDAQSRIDAQMPLASKTQLADVTLMNDDSIQQLHEQVEALLSSTRQQSQSVKHVLLSPAGLGACLLGVAALAGFALVRFWRDTFMPVVKL